MIDRLITLALENWDAFSTDSPSPGDVRWVVQSRRRVIVFLFDAQNAANRLVAVMKVSRRPQENPALQRSVSTMAAVRARLHGPIRSTVPRAILLPPINGLSVSLEQAMPGKPMALGRLPGLAAVRNRRNWTAWRAWLRQFQHQTATPSELITPATIDEQILPEMVLAFDEDAAASSIIEDLHAVLRQLEGHPAWSVWRYGDAHHSNILLNRQMVTGVIDWEGAETGAWPTADWLQFGIQYLVDVYRLQAPHASQSALGERAIDGLLRSPPTRLERMVQQQTRDFLSTWDIDPRLFPAFVIAFLAQFYWPWDKARLLRRAHAAICR